MLRSQAEHGGPQKWLMYRQQDVPADGAAISAPGFSVAGWQEAIVPGTVLNSLVHDEIYPEPYFGLNNAHEQKLIPDLSETGPAFYTYWFRTEFAAPVGFKGRQVWLQFDGINYRAEIWLNGRRLGDLAGMFQCGIFNATTALNDDGTNVLAVLVHPVDKPGGFRQKNKTIRAAGENRNGGDGEIGRNTTMLMTVGWDFTFTDGIRDRNTGIWRDVKLFATGPVVLRNAFVQSKLPLPALAPARETICVDLVNATAEPQSGRLTARVKEAGIKIEKEISLQPNETRTVTLTPDEFKALSIAKPRLWWPVNKGEQFLHHLSLEFAQGKTISDRSETRFGIREITSDQNTPDRSREFLVNGRRIFLHGSNWIPEAMCRTSRERTEAELRYTRQSGVNFLRLWAGGVAESDDFYDQCDELGILVWNEFWLTGDTQLPGDRALYRTNVTDTILRVRNHASLAYYVSANERPGAPNTKVDPSLIVPMKDIVEKLDPTRGWQQSSETDGVHDGSPYVAENPMFYYEDTASPRGSRINGLCPEYGCPILPTVDCLREMMPEKDLWPINKAVWDYLDGGGFHGMTGNYNRCVEQYGPSANIEEYAMKAQAFGGLAWRAIWECWNENKFDYGDRFSTGLLFWYHNSPNRQVCGRMWDWSLEPTAALYFTQNALEPLHAQFDFLKNTVAVNNELPREFNGQVTARVLDFDMREVFRKTAHVHAGAEGLATNVLAITFPPDVSPVHFIKLELADERGKPVSQTFYWRSAKQYLPGRTWTGPQYEGFEGLTKLPKVQLDSAVKWGRADGENVCTVTVKNPTRSLAFMAWLRLQHAADAKPVRPAFYDDNFFSLLPGESRTVRIKFGDRAADMKEVRLLVDGWNVEPKAFLASGPGVAKNQNEHRASQ
ncbi:MAG TPA: glycoside hydrolase family 2 protein [Candidatus Acidoferrales bacterium]|jgi:mannosylglycoprotein endo-beta-mannosidase|nr:glycoside hydrolase family 2 protein [Candidatus Acidoferrales bacterium]